MKLAEKLFIINMCIVYLNFCYSTRTKRIEEEDKPRSRTKRIDFVVEEMDRSKRTKRIEQEKSLHNEKRTKDKPMTNDVQTLQNIYLGSCSGQKVNQTFTSTFCTPVTVEVLVCGGICDANIKALVEKSALIDEQCTFCGPPEYEERFLFFQCNTDKGKKRRLKMDVRKIFIPKKCVCLKDSCYKRNKLSNEHIL